MNKSIAAVVLLFLAACTPDIQMASAQPIKLSTSDIKAIQAVEASEVFDPTAVLFRNFVGYDAAFKDGHVERRACYEMNGKNRMGGYVGYKMYSAKKVGSQWVTIGEGCQKPGDMMLSV